MARNFVTASSQYIEFPDIDALVTTTYTVAQRFTIDALGAAQLGLASHGITPSGVVTLFFFAVNTAGTCRMLVQGSGSGNPSINVDTTSSPSVGLGTWHSLVGTRNVDTIEIFLNGVSEASGTAGSTLGTIVSNNYLIGALNYGGATQAYHDGNIADVAVWDVVLTSAEIAAYNKGVSPTLIRPASLVSYMPLWGTTQEPDLGGLGGIGTLTNTPVIATTNPGVMPYKRRSIPIQSSVFDQGFCINGIVQENGVNVSRTVRVYLSSTGALLGSTVSNASTGAYTICNIPSAAEVFVIAFDDSSGDSFNAEIFDKVIPVE